MNEIHEKADVDKENGTSSKSIHSNIKKPAIPVTKIIVAATIVVIAVGSFSLGIIYQKHHDKTLSATQLMKSQIRGVGIYGNTRSGGQHRLGEFGQVIRITGTSITISDIRSGVSKTFNITNATKITDNGQLLTASNVQNGETVMIKVSSANSNAASYIMVNPSFGGPMMSNGSATTN